MKERLTRVEICEKYLKCASAFLNNVISKSGHRKEFPKSGLGKKYDVVKVLEFLERYSSGKIQLNAASALASIRHSEEKKSEEKKDDKNKKNDTTSKDDIIKESNFERGKRAAAEILPAELNGVEIPNPQGDVDYNFNREDDYDALLRKYGFSVGKMFENLGLAISSGDIALQAQISNLLSKLVAVLGVEQARSIEIKTKLNELMFKSDVKKIFTMLCTNIKSKIMLLPSKLAPELVGISSQQRVKEILEEEITEVLVGLRDDPFGN